MAKIIHWYKHRTKKKTKDDDNAVSTKTMENVKNHRNIKLITTEARGNNWAFEHNYHITIFNNFLIIFKFISNKNKKNTDTCQ